MQLLIFLIAYPILWLISILPFRIFYWFSDIIYIVVYKLVGYRKRVVRQNIALALPHLSEKERLAIEKKFYQHMCDMFLEMIKTISISEKEMQSRFKVNGIEVLKEFEDKNKSIVLLTSHYASWEWLISINSLTKFKTVGVYKQIANPYFDKLVRKIRSKYGTDLVTTSQTINYITEHEKSKQLCLYALVSDQSPKINRAFHWNTFMGIEAPIHTGAEMLAKRHELGVAFVDVRKVKRGYYEATFSKLTDTPKNFPDFEITDQYLKLVEKQIHEAPEYYLWTHKRWKHQR